MIQDRGTSWKTIALVLVKDSNGLGGECVWGCGGGEMERCGWSQEI